MLKGIGNGLKELFTKDNSLVSKVELDKAITKIDELDRINRSLIKENTSLKMRLKRKSTVVAILKGKINEITTRLLHMKKYTSDINDLYDFSRRILNPKDRRFGETGSTGGRGIDPEDDLIREEINKPKNREKHNLIP